MANTLACLCLYHWSTFWTYLVTVSLFSLYLMNFMFNITLDAVGNSLRLHCKSMKCDVSLSQGSVRWGEHVSCMWKIVLPVYSSAKVIKKNQTSFSRVIITNVLPLFYESQCILCVCTDPDVNGEWYGVTSIVVHYCADLQSVDEFRCSNNIREMSASACTRSVPGCEYSLISSSYKNRTVVTIHNSYANS